MKWHFKWFSAQCLHLELQLLWHHKKAKRKDAVGCQPAMPRDTATVHCCMITYEWYGMVFQMHEVHALQTKEEQQHAWEAPVLPFGIKRIWR